ncbi:glycosyltransferase family 2 protein [Pedobacter sp. SAFR-022]|uniref:glycosyltransferase family 2 protein n=1 Tax=Pedobacter sp. SAFR-022 TaxID=3436861 RepID=UPI003F823E90
MTINPLISIIIPAYNVGKNLHVCLDSVLNQSYPHFEILLVNDGSIDETGDICDEYGKKDPRIRVFHKTNGGVGSARNVGLRNVKGDFICFLDSDDWIESDYFEQFLQSREDGNALIIFNHYVERKQQVTKKFSYQNVSYKKNDFSSAFTYLNFLRIGFICAKFFSSEIVKKHKIVFHEEIHYAEDLLFNLQYLKYIDQLKYLDYTGYHYMHYNPDSLSKTHNSFFSEYQAFELLKAELDVIIKCFELSHAAQVYIKNWLGRFFLRAIQTFYHNNSALTFTNRIQLLKKAYLPQNVKYLEGIEVLKLPAPIQFSIYLYKKGSFALYDQYMRLLFKLHRIKVNLPLVNR